MEVGAYDKTVTSPRKGVSECTPVRLSVRSFAYLRNRAFERTTARTPHDGRTDGAGGGDLPVGADPGVGAPDLADDGQGAAAAGAGRGGAVERAAEGAWPAADEPAPVSAVDGGVPGAHGGAVVDVDRRAREQLVAPLVPLLVAADLRQVEDDLVQEVVVGVHHRHRAAAAGLVRASGL